MINENTLNKLNNIGFGADIDALESYIIDFKQSSLLCDMSQYEYNHAILFDILKEVKPNSLAFSERTSLKEIELDKQDSLFIEYGNERIDLAYGIDSLAVNTMKSSIDCETDQIVDIIGITNVDGIDINCIYLHGYMYRIYAIGKNKKYINLTGELKNKVPNYISDLECFDLVELRGKATLFKNSDAIENSLNIPCSVVRCIRTDFTSDIQLVFNDIIIDDNDIVELPYKNHWEKMEFLRDMELSVPHHLLIRSVDRDSLDQALVQLDEAFLDIKNEGSMIYSYSGVIIRFNESLDYNAIGDKLIYISNNVDSSTKFSSTVKSISTTYDGDKFIQKLNIIRIKCNEQLSIKHIELDDIYDLEKYDINIGNKVTFIVVEGKAVLC